LTRDALDGWYVAVVALDCDVPQTMAQERQRALEALAQVDAVPRAGRLSARERAQGADDLASAARTLVAILQRAGQVGEPLGGAPPTRPPPGRSTARRRRPRAFARARRWRAAGARDCR